MAEVYNNIHPGLGLDETLLILSSPLESLESSSDYYMAASHLINFPGVRTEDALLNLVRNDATQQPIRLARRKAVEVLARLNCQRAIDAIGACLHSDDPYLVENAAWSLQELNCASPQWLEAMCSLLDDPSQTRRVLIKSLASLGYRPAVAAIERLNDDPTPSVRSAVISAVIQLRGDHSQVNQLADYLVLPNQMDRQSAIQDVIDCGGVPLLSDVLRAPVSPVFRMRALRSLGERAEQTDGVDFDLVESIDRLLLDCPDDLHLVHQYDEPPDESFLIQEFFGTDFSRCYLAFQTLMKRSADVIWPILKRRWFEEAHNDYGAHYFFVRLMASRADWPSECLPEIQALLEEAMMNRRPQFMKSRPVAVLSLMHPFMQDSCRHLSAIMQSAEAVSWDCRYAAMMVVERNVSWLQSYHDLIAQLVLDADPFLQRKAQHVLRNV